MGDATASESSEKQCRARCTRSAIDLVAALIPGSTPCVFVTAVGRTSSHLLVIDASGGRSLRDRHDVCERANINVRSAKCTASPRTPKQWHGPSFFKSAIDSAAKIGVLGAPSHDLRHHAAKRGVVLFQEERGLMNPVGAPPLKGQNEVPQKESDRWSGWLSIFNP